MPNQLHYTLLVQLEAAAARAEAFSSLEIDDGSADFLPLAAMAEDYRALVELLECGDDESLSAQLEALTQRARVLLLPKTREDRLGALLVFHSATALAERLKRMYVGFAESLHCAISEVRFSDGCSGLCIRQGDLLVCLYQLLKRETGVHHCGEERCAVTVFPLATDISSEGYSFEAFAPPEDRSFHRFASCARVTRDGLACESLSLRSAVQNRALALSALASRLKCAAEQTELIRDYDFSRGILFDRRLGQTFPIGDLMPLFDSLLLAE